MAGSSNYGQLPLPQQLQLINGEQANMSSLSDGIKMWQAVPQTFQKAYHDLSTADSQLTEWTDGTGGLFKSAVGQGLNSLRSWQGPVSSAASGVSAPLQSLVAEIPRAAQQIAQLNQEAQALQAAAAAGGPTAASASAALLALQQQGGQELQKVADLYNAASQALQPIQSGPNWAGAGGSGGGSPSGGPNSPATGGGTPSSQDGQQGQQQPDGQNSQQSPAGQGGDPSGQSGDPGQSDQTGDPALSGTPTMTAPTLPTDPNLTVPPVSTPPATPDPSIGALPIMSPALGGGRGAGGARVGGGVPGVKVGGPKQIPQAAKPVAAGEPVTNGTGPEVPAGESAPGASAGGTAGGGMIPPMGMPMAGGVGRGGAASTRQARRHSGRRDGRPDAVPGVPAALRGKAGQVDPLAFAPPAWPSRRDPAADLATVQVLDEQMWQVGSTDVADPPTY